MADYSGGNHGIRSGQNGQPAKTPDTMQKKSD
jgi:hypothetical protein